MIPTLAQHKTMLAVIIRATWTREYLSLLRVFALCHVLCHVHVRARMSLTAAYFKI